MHIDIRSEPSPHPYCYHIGTTDGYDSDIIRDVSSDDQNVVNQGENFEFDVNVPAGVDFCIKVVAEKGRRSDSEYRIVSSNFIGIVRDMNGEIYLGSSGGFLTTCRERPGTRWSNWIHSEEPICFSFKGRRGKGILRKSCKLEFHILFRK